jgi:hypothetical protein
MPQQDRERDDDFNVQPSRWSLPLHIATLHPLRPGEWNLRGAARLLP